MKTHGENPWRRLRALGDEWELAWSSDLPDDVYGYTDHARRVITLREGMSFEERRCTIAHEVHHARRGPVAAGDTLAEELLVDRYTAHQLLPSLRDVADALMWAHGDYEVAAVELWVDPLVLEVRMSSLDSPEREYMEARLAQIVLGDH